MYVYLGVVKFPVDLARLDLAQRNLLLLDVVQDHKEEFVLFCMSGVIVGHCHHCTVVFQYNG